MRYHPLFELIYPKATRPSAIDEDPGNYDLAPDGSFTLWDAGMLGPEPTEAEWAQKVQDYLIGRINEECTAILLAKWPAERQISMRKGFYPDDVGPCSADVNTLVNYSNALSDALDDVPKNTESVVEDLLDIYRSRTWPAI